MFYEHATGDFLPPCRLVRIKKIKNYVKIKKRGSFRGIRFRNRAVSYFPSPKTDQYR